MMTVHFMPMEVTTFLHCRRGRNTYRKVRIDIGRTEAIYNALPQSALEVVDAMGHVWSRADVQENRGKIILDFQGPPSKKEQAERDAAEKRVEEAETKEAAVKELQQEIDNFEVKNEGTNAPKVDQRSEEKDDDNMQQVGGERSPNGETLRRGVHLQVPFVGTVHARLLRPKERGPEGGSDGVHGSNDEQDVLDN